MRIRLIHYPLHTLGPGERLGIWTMGCNKNCVGCMSKSLQIYDENYQIEIETFMNDLKDLPCDITQTGVTISGGEPFDNLDFDVFLKHLKSLSFNNIIAYTGYTIDELHSMKKSYIEESLKLIDVLVDGRYIEELNDNHPMKGSSNQIIHIFNDALKPSITEYCKGSRRYEVEEYDNHVIFYGMLPPKKTK